MKATSLTGMGDAIMNAQNMKWSVELIANGELDIVAKLTSEQIQAVNAYIKQLTDDWEQ